MKNPRSAQANIDRAMADGVGGLEFTAQAPPGVGRLIRIPFYLTSGTAGFNAIGTTAVTPTATTTSSTQPVINAASPNEAGLTTVSQTGTAGMQTPQISWATLRLVGFEVACRYPIIPNGPVPQLVVKNLQIGGGATLFVHENYAPVDIYLSGSDSFAGLRDYPIIQSPNFAQVDVALLGPVGQTVSRLTYSASLVCEILSDDNYGAHVPGPYARAGALVRKGGAFVSRA